MTILQPNKGPIISAQATEPQSCPPGTWRTPWRLGASRSSPPPCSCPWWSSEFDQMMPRWACWAGGSCWACPGRGGRVTTTSLLAPALLWRTTEVSRRDPSQLSGSRRSGEIPLSSVPAVEESASWWQCGSEFSYRLLSRSSWGDGLPRCWSLSGNCCFHVSRWLRSIYHIDLILILIFIIGNMRLKYNNSL